MEIVLTELLSAVIRWTHVIAGVAWIGSSFYFIHLDLSLKKPHTPGTGIKGEAWQVHGGGFYQMIKFMVAPPAMPDELTWFKWEAYATWLSGFSLLVVVYYFNAELFLIDKSVLDMSAPMAAAIAFFSLAAAWLAYEALCRSPLGAIVLLIGPVIRHFYNSRHEGKPSPWWTWFVAAFGMMLVAWLCSLGPPVQKAGALPPTPKFAEVQDIIISRCSMCHTAEPVWTGFGAPPKGVRLDSGEQIALHAKMIAVNAVKSNAMPPGNVTEMTLDERMVLASWLAAGAPAQ